MRSSVRRRVQPVIDAQLGVVTSTQLRELKVDPRLPRREGWLRLATGTWLTTPEATDEQLLQALTLYAPSAVASGGIACRRYGVRYATDAVGCDALVPHGTTLLGGPTLRLRQTRRMPDPVEHHGRPFAPVQRAVLDATRWAASLRAARALLLGALGDRRLDVDDAVDDLAEGPHDSHAQLSRVVEDWLRGARSAPEAEAADALLALRGPLAAPPFLLNPELRLEGVLIGRPDGYLPASGLGWEQDSVEFHAAAEDLDATLSRHRRFDDAGLQLLHSTPSRFRADRRTWAIDVVRRSAARRATGWTPPPGLVVVPAGPVLGGVGLLAA